MNSGAKITLMVIICLVTMIAIGTLVLLLPGTEAFYKIIETVQNFLGLDAGMDALGG